MDERPFDEPADPHDPATSYRIQRVGRLIALDLIKSRMHPRDQMAALVVAISLAMTYGLDENVTDEEASEMLKSVIPETVAMFRINRKSFKDFMERYGM